MPVLYNDSFGYWQVDDAEELAFFKYVQSQSVSRSCQRCRGAVRLMPPKHSLRAVRIRARMRRAALDGRVRAVEARKSGFASR
jgi:hypothetical protein